MSFLTSAKIKVKILSVLTAVSVVALGGAAYMGREFQTSDTVYTRFVNADAVALRQIARADRNFVSLFYDAYRTGLHDPQSGEIGFALDDLKTNSQQMYERMNEARGHLPEKAAAIDGFVAEMHGIETALQALVDGNARGEAQAFRERIADLDM